MLARLLPHATDSEYRGSRAALWLLGVTLLMKAGIALGSIFNGHYAASVADGIPIDSYTPQGALTVVALFGALGVSQLAIAAIGTLVLFRYQSLVPLFILLLLLEYLARKGVTLHTPIPRSAGAPGSAISWAIFGVMALAFVLSLRRVGAARV